MLAKFSGVESDRTYLSLEKEKENLCSVFTNSIERAREIKMFPVAVTTDEKCTKKRDARAKLLFC